MGLDDVAAHGLGDQGRPAGHVELEHGRSDALLDAALADAEVPGDLFRGQALGNIENALQLTRSQAPAKMANPLPYGDRVHDVSRVAALESRSRLSP